MEHSYVDINWLYARNAHMYDGSDPVKYRFQERAGAAPKPSSKTPK